jgi:putative transposase
MKKRYRDEEIAGFLRAADQGEKVSELARKHGFSVSSFSLWKKRFGSINSVEIKRLRQLESENARLKKKLAEAVLDADILKEALAKKW